MTERETFDRAMDLVLKANPKLVKEQMEKDARDRAEARQIKRASLDPGLDDPA